MNEIDKIKQQYLNDIGITRNENEMEEIEWLLLSRQKKLSEDFIRIFKDKVTWEYVSKEQILSEDFIQEFADKVDWVAISSYQSLSEQFIIKNKDKVKWYFISKNQNLSDNFLIEYKKNIDWNWYFYNQEASYPIIQKFILKSTFKSLGDFKTSHLTKLEKQNVEKLFKLNTLFKNEK